MNFIESVKNAGVVGAGGAGFPTHIKLNTKAEIFIVNAAECEPLIETDKFICREYADKIVSAITYVCQHLEAKRAVIALKGKYHEEIKCLKTAINKANANIEIFEMRTFYPAGDEQIMVQQVIGQSVPERGIPIEVGAVVDNVGTLLNIYDAISDKPVTRKLLSVVGEVERPIMLDVPIGTSILECIKVSNPKISDYRIILGGPMMGKVVHSFEQIQHEYVKKTTGNIIVLPSDHYLFKVSQKPIEKIISMARSSCIQCRMCTDLCPRYQIGHNMRPHLVMRNLYREHLIDDNFEYEKAFGDAVNCSECGACEMFSCPMSLSPRKANSYIKKKLRDRGISIAKIPSATSLPTVDNTKIPTDRLIARLGLSSYNGKHAHECKILNPDKVFIEFSQHIGKPAECVLTQGMNVTNGQLIAKISENALGANIHSSIDGTVTDIKENGIFISK